LQLADTDVPRVATGIFDREPITSLEEIKRFLDREAKIGVTGQIASGKMCDVYAGQYGQRALAIKLFDNSAFSKSIQKKLLDEVQLTAKLNHPTFLRISNVFFDKHLCLIVSDHVGDGQTIAAAINAKGRWAFSAERASDVLNQLCGAIIEAERLGLQCLCVTPSQIFVRDIGANNLPSDRMDETRSDEANPGFAEQCRIGNIVRLSPINFAFFKSRIGNAGTLWSNETVPFIAPELGERSRWFREHMEPKLGGHATEGMLQSLKLHKSHQFALGMLAWTMLKGGLPYTPDGGSADVDSSEYAEELKEQFLDASKNFAAEVARTQWPTEKRALARIVKRMVEYDPADR
jgi:serine/threonine protein kinase